MRTRPIPPGMPMERVDRRADRAWVTPTRLSANTNIQLVVATRIVDAGPDSAVTAASTTGPVIVWAIRPGGVRIPLPASDSRNDWTLTRRRRVPGLR
ncbi:hypothetical protein ACWEK5_42940 [Rhodococcus koreensis]